MSTRKSPCYTSSCSTVHCVQFGPKNWPLRFFQLESSFVGNISGSVAKYTNFQGIVFSFIVYKDLHCCLSWGSCRWGFSLYVHNISTGIKLLPPHLSVWWNLWGENLCKPCKQSTIRACISHNSSVGSRLFQRKYFTDGFVHWGLQNKPKVNSTISSSPHTQTHMHTSNSLFYATLLFLAFSPENSTPLLGSVCPVLCRVDPKGFSDLQWNSFEWWQKPNLFMLPPPKTLGTHWNHGAPRYASLHHSHDITALRWCGGSGPVTIY